MITLACTLLFAFPLEDPMVFENRMPALFKIVSLAGSIMLILLFVLPSVIVGIGLTKQKGWADNFILPLGCFYLLVFPLGTAIGVYCLVVFFSNRDQSRYKQESPLETNQGVQ
ncbi:hypothetical protein PZB74_16675 [Porifericola rhodea]|uniref:hypothetical protein n=1 Tax=Porifericola rhodea TaxID=930972 RepID=UPI0026666DA1|nr:hypothetical protein [Porifericola rhodea]WKN30599.1 hypothetical protein PZB74_16675 [Porifericola rhodea]